VISAVQSANASSPLWPDGDVVVLQNRPLRSGTDLAALSRFADQAWKLTPAHPDAHYVVNAIRWRSCPGAFLLPLKTFALAALDHKFPLDLAVGRSEDFANVATIQAWLCDLLVFATWLEDQGIKQLTGVTGKDLDAYRVHVMAMARSAGRKACLFNAVRALWAYREHLPRQCQMAAEVPWSGASGHQLAQAVTASRVNKTPRIDPATMEALLAWALRIVEIIGPDIRDAWTAYRQLGKGTHPSQERYEGLLMRDRVRLFLAQAHADGCVLPGRVAGGKAEVNWSHRSRLLGQWSSWPPALKRPVLAAGLPVADGSPVGSISGRLDGRPWRDRPITAQELPQLIRVLTAACFVTACYLSGARPGEILNLERGCTGIDDSTGEYLFHGRAGKGPGRTAAAEDQAGRARSWVTVGPAHAALAMMESLTGHRFVFPASLALPTRRRSNDDHARKAAAVNQDIAILIAWVNDTFRHPDGTLPIPPDPTRHVHAARFRRSLAYFIVRRPRGLIAAALQYAHVSTKVTLSYAGSADTSWMDDLAIERLEMVVDQIGDDLALLEDGEHVSGPSAAEYRARIAGVSRFAGRAVTHVRNVQRLLDSADPRIHHGEAMTCVWRAETAACRKAKIAQGLPADDVPDETECRTTCQNLAWTDRGISQLRDRLATLEANAADPLVPRPLRDRAAAQATRAQDIIARHQATRPPGGSGEMEDCGGR
jgi:integrase